MRVFLRKVLTLGVNMAGEQASMFVFGVFFSALGFCGRQTSSTKNISLKIPIGTMRWDPEVDSAKEKNPSPVWKNLTNREIATKFWVTLLWAGPRWYLDEETTQGNVGGKVWGVVSVGFPKPKTVSCHPGGNRYRCWVWGCRWSSFVPCSQGCRHCGLVARKLISNPCPDNWVAIHET